YEIDLAEKNLMAPREEMKDLGMKLWAFGMAVLILLGSYKLVVAHMKGHSNVGFLIAMSLVGAIGFSIACFALPRLSYRGKTYLERLKLAYGGLKDQLKDADDWGIGLDVLGRPPGELRAKRASAYSDGLLLVGIFGISSLTDTPLSDLKTMFAS